MEKNPWRHGHNANIPGEREDLILCTWAGVRYPLWTILYWMRRSLKETSILNGKSHTFPQSSESISGTSRSHCWWSLDSSGDETWRRCAYSTEVGFSVQSNRRIRSRSDCTICLSPGEDWALKAWDNCRDLNLWESGTSWWDIKWSKENIVGSEVMSERALIWYLAHNTGSGISRKCCRLGLF